VVVADLPAEAVMTADRSRRGTVLLALGAGVGIALAASGLVASGHAPARGLPAGAVARVDGELVRVDDFERAVAALAADRRDGVDAAERRRVLDRLIDEELLVQRGLALGLARQDARVRRELAGAVIETAVARGEVTEPSAAEVEAFYESEREFFAPSAQLRVRQVWCRAGAPAAERRAREAAERLRAGDDFFAVRNALGDRDPSALPDALVAAPKLLDYLGPTALRAALELPVGGVSEPVRSASGHHVLQVVERAAGEVPPLADIRGEVVAELRRRAGESALRAYLDELRARATIELAARP
jgi:parvulin-like peptidyl-prolyl isomerase